MDNRHAIDQAVFDISFDSAEAAATQQHELAGFIREQLLPLAEEIFGELSVQGSVSRIDLLEIDLGDIRYDGYREEMAGRFRERLRTKLQDKLREIGAAPSALEYTLDRSRAEGEQLRHFLETGNLARGVRSSAEAFERMLLRSLESSGGGFATYLRGAPERATIVGRMARQFPRAALSAVLRLLAPEQAARLERRADEYLQAQLRERPQAAASELMPGIWEALLHGLLQGDGRIADAERQFEDRMRKQLPAQRAAPEPAAASLLAARLEAALYGNSGDRLEQLWGEALRTAPGTLRAVFAARFGDARARHSLVAALSHEQLLELAALVVPQLGPAIAAQFSSPEVQAMLAGGGRVALWERVLGVLHEGGTLDRERFERQLQNALRQEDGGDDAARIEAVLAAGDAQALHDILRRTRRQGRLWSGLLLRPDAVGRKRFAELLEHDDLLELAALAVPQHGPAIVAQFARPEVQAMLAGGGKAGLWERVLGVLHEGGVLDGKRFERELLLAVQANGSAEAAASIDGDGGREAGAVVAQHGTDREESSSGDGQASQVLQRLLRSDATGLEEASVDELVQLVRQLVRRNGAPPGGDFERGIERHALQAPYVRAYYREVLRQLLDGGNVDLEQAAQAGATAPMSGTALLQARLEAAMVQGRADALEGCWDVLLGDHPALVRETFLRRMGEERLRRKLAAGFPQPMLRQLLELLVPRQSGQVAALLAEISRNAGQTDGAALQAEGWEYTLACLHAAAEGGFEFEAYVRGLVRRLATFDAPAASTETAAYRLLHRLQGRAPQADASRDIRLLSAAEAAEFGALLRRLRDGEIRPGLLALGGAELRLLAAAIVRLQAGAEGEDFLAEIEKHAGRASDAQRYYLHVVECLLHERIVDLEQAQAEAQEAGAGAGAEHAPAGALRHWLERMLARSAAGTAGLAPDRAGYVWEAYSRIMADAQARRELLSGQPEALMLELAATLQPAAGRIAALLRNSAAGRAAREFWPLTFKYLDESGRDGFSARDYLGRMLAFHDDAADGEAAVNADRLTPTEVHALLAACAAEPESARGDVLDGRGQLHRLLRATALRRPEDAVPASREAALRTRFASALDAAAVGEIDALRDELSQHEDMARSVLLERIADAQLCASIAAKLPESVLAGLLDLAVPGMGKLAGTLAQRLRRQGAAEAVAVLWRHALGSLQTEARGFSPRRYERSLAGHLAAMGVELADARAVAETGQAAAGPERVPLQAERAALLQRQVAQRLAGSSGEEMTEQLEELAAVHPEMLRELLRQLRSGELRLAAAQLAEREVELFAGLLAELEPDAQRGMPGLRGRQDSIELIERLVGGRQSGTAAAQQDAGGRAEAAEAGLEAALAAQDAQTLDALWQRNRQHAAALRRFFRTALADARNRSWLAGWLPQARLPELAGLLRPRESPLVAALSSLPGLASAQQAAAVRAAWCELTLEFLGATETVTGRANYVRTTVRRLAELGLEEDGLWREILRADAALGVLRPQAGGEAGRSSQPETGLAQAGVMDGQAGTARDRAAVLAADLEAALHGGDLLVRLWDAALREHPTLLRSVLAAQLGEDRTRYRLAAQLSHGQLLELVQLVAPQRGAAVAALFAGIEVEPANGGKQRLWQTLLGVLHEYDAGRLDGAHFEQALQGIAAEPSADDGVAARIESVLADGNAGRFAQLWAEALRDDPATLRRTMVALLATTAARRRLGAVLSRAQLSELVALLVPRHSVAVAALFAGAGTQAVAADDGEEWQRLFGLLHEYGTGRLDDASFERALRYVPQAGAGSSGAGTGRYGEIVRRLRGEAGAAKMDAALGELETREPQAYAELLGRLQSGEFAAALERLDADELAQLAGAVARHNGAPPGGDFELSIGHHAQLAADPAVYYREVLQQLFDGGAVDLELAASAPRQPAIPTASQAQTMSQAQTASGGKAMSKEPAGNGQPTAFEYGDGKRSGKVEKELYVANAGLVLAAPYLPHLFGMLGLKDENGFVDAAAAERAVHLTQFVVNESCDSPEFLLPLNRILCGVPDNQPIVREIRISDLERNTVEEMLRAIIANWKGVGNTSVAGLRESFLQRAGRLTLQADSWHLEVEKHAIDVLLDSLPWSYAMVKYSWMPQPLHVEWR